MKTSAFGFLRAASEMLQAQGQGAKVKSKVSFDQPSTHQPWFTNYGRARSNFELMMIHTHTPIAAELDLVTHTHTEHRISP